MTNRETLFVGCIVDFPSPAVLAKTIRRKFASRSFWRWTKKQQARSSYLQQQMPWKIINHASILFLIHICLRNFPKKNLLNCCSHWNPQSDVSSTFSLRLACNIFFCLAGSEKCANAKTSESITYFDSRWRKKKSLLQFFFAFHWLRPCKKATERRSQGIKKLEYSLYASKNESTIRRDFLSLLFLWRNIM